VSRNFCINCYRLWMVCSLWFPVDGLCRTIFSNFNT
jgi:hypothetical protein